MKKFFFSALFIAAFATYALYQYFGNSSQILAVNPLSPGRRAISAPVAVSVPVAAQQPAPAPVATSAPKPSGQYTDGTYTGSAADAYYGTVQVQAVIQGGKLADVIFLQHPSDRSYSIRVNTYAMPILKSEAIQAQNANVDIVSGATDSSMAFQQSLGSALAQAKA